MAVRVAVQSVGVQAEPDTHSIGVVTSKPRRCSVATSAEPHTHSIGVVTSKPRRCSVATSPAVVSPVLRFEAEVQTLPVVVESDQGSVISDTAASTDFFQVGVQVTGEDI